MTTATRKYTRAHRTADLAKLAKRIEVLRRRGERQRDPEDAEAFRQDAADLEKVAGLVRKGRLEAAGNYAFELDTAVCDDIPIRMYRALEDAAYGE